VRLKDLPHEVTDQSVPVLEIRAPAVVFTDDLATIERAKVVEVLRRESGNKTRAARALGIDRRKLYRLVEKYDIQSNEFAKVVTAV